MMQFMLLFSRQGKLRLQKWYVAHPDKLKKKITRELITTVLARKPKMCSFLEWKDVKIVYKRSAVALVLGDPVSRMPKLHFIWLKGVHKRQRIYAKEWPEFMFPDSYKLDVLPRLLLGKLVPLSTTSSLTYRYASLYFCCAMEQEDNELLTLELIHRYVELLDKYFGSVCELDIIFNFEKAYFILDELVLGGELQETSKKNVLKAIAAQDLLQEDETVDAALREVGLL